MTSDQIKYFFGRRKMGVLDGSVIREMGQRFEIGQTGGRQSDSEMWRNFSDV